MAKDINKTEFKSSTLLKLEIFRKYFSKWLPVFIVSKFYKEVYIFDFFAGSGKDDDNNFGSPLELLSEAKKICSLVNKKTHFIFNDEITEKTKLLKANVEAFFQDCKIRNNCSFCKYTYEIFNNKFHDLLDSDDITPIMQNKNYGKFLLLDQYGFSQVDEVTFHNLTHYPSTDFIFFITSSYIRRFKDHEFTKKYINTEDVNFDKLSPDQCHRIITEIYRRLLDNPNEYFLHNFSIQKENKGNIYGLIFGCKHTLGMEKFLHVCWQLDDKSGEANYDIEHNDLPGTLFHNENSNNKIDRVKFELRRMLLKGEISDNITGLKKAMALGCLPKIFIKVLKEEEKNMTVRRVGTDLNYAASNIHNINEYKIERINHGT